MISPNSFKKVYFYLDFAPTGKNAQIPYCTSLSWSADGTDLYAGYTDNIIRVYNVSGSV